MNEDEINFYYYFIFVYLKKNVNGWKLTNENGIGYWFFFSFGLKFKFEMQGGKRSRGRKAHNYNSWLIWSWRLKKITKSTWQVPLYIEVWPAFLWLKRMRKRHHVVLNREKRQSHPLRHPHTARLPHPATFSIIFRLLKLKRKKCIYKKITKIKNSFSYVTFF